MIGPLRAQRRAQAALAVPGELEQLVLVDAEQRALQHRRQRQIVLRQQQRVGQHHQVHHRDVLGQHQPVGAGDRDALVLQRADDRPRTARRAAAPGSARPWRAGPGAATARRCRRCACASFTVAAGAALWMSNGASHGSTSLRSSVLVGSQISTRPGRRLRQRLVDRRFGSAVSPAWAAGGKNTVSTAPSTFSPERNECLNSVATKSSCASLCKRLEVVAHRREFARRRALEREDRLLLVADREDRARAGRARPRRRRIRRPAPSRSPIASGSCPAPRRSAHDGCRGRACSAPRRPTRC